MKNKFLLIIVFVLTIIIGCKDKSGYNCNSGTCTATFENPQYLTLSDCQSVCTNSSNTAGYNCENSSCISVSNNAEYSTLSDCESVCGNSSSTAGYNCVNGNCVWTNSNAQYPTLYSCQNCGVQNLGVPTLSIPANGATNLWHPITFSWSAVSDASKYELEAVSGSNLNSGFVIQSNLTTNSFTTTLNLDNSWKGKTINWRVRAVKGAIKGNWSAYWSFKLKS